MKYFLAKYILWIVLGAILIAGVISLVRMKDDIKLTLSFPLDQTLPITYKLLEPNTIIHPSLNESGTLIEEVQNAISSSSVTLTEESILARTNALRIKEGLPSLSRSATLTKSATMKAEDIISKQYFAHESPDSRDVSDLVTDVGYKYISVGENLALGTFANPDELLDAWMNSDGHKENILSARYTEIGIGVVRGVYKGSSVWVIVQHFGKPLATCRMPDELFRIKVEREIANLENTYQEIQDEQKMVRSHRSPIDYEVAVEQLNDHIDEYNASSKNLERSIEEYNESVATYNACIAG